MNTLKNYEQQKQKQFEQQIELLILYKKSNPKKNVYLTEETINTAFKWYSETFSIIKEQMILNKTD